MTDKRRLAESGDRPSEQITADPTASFTYELATQSPTKNVASVKAASEVFEANAADGNSARTQLHRDRNRKV